MVEVAHHRVGRPWLVHRADLPNVVRIALGVPMFLAPAWIGIEPDIGGLAVALAVLFALNDMNFLLHQHVHCRLSPRRWVNHALDAVLGVMTGMTASCWQQHHVLRHHQLDDSWGRGWDWELRRRNLLGTVTYSVRGAFVIIVRPYCEAIVRGLVRRETTPIDYRWAFVLQTANFAVMALLIASVPWFYAPFYALVWFFSRRTDYENHVGCDDAGMNFANNVIDDRYNWIRNNFGYHTAHHIHPSVHWTELPALHTEIADQIPPDRMEGIRWTRSMNPMLVAFGLAHRVHLRRQRRRLAPA